MEVKEVNVEQKIKYLFNIATSYIGKEIDINKDSYFIIDEICHEDVVGEYNYHICYSLGNNGMIDIYYIYSSNSNSFRIDNIIFYVRNDKGILEKYKYSNSISNNLLVMRLLDNAIRELSKATILGDCIYPMKKDSSTKRLCLSRYSQM